MTPTASLLLAAFEKEAAEWNKVATDPDDMNTFLRNAARARRDQLDWTVQQLRTALPAIEEEAVEAFFEPDDRTPPHEADPVDDGDEDPWCWCGHAIERRP